MKCPLYFTVKQKNAGFNLDLDYREVVALRELLLCRIFYVIDNELEVGSDQVFIFENENYEVGEDVTGRVIKKRKDLTAFVEQAVQECVLGWGFQFHVVLYDAMHPLPPLNYLEFKVRVEPQKALMYYDLPVEILAHGLSRLEICDE